MRIIFWYTIILILTSCITTIFGLERFPHASRELASSVSGDIEMVKFYFKIGIVGYGFISALAYLIPIIVLLVQKQDWRHKRHIYLIALLLIAYTVIKAQYTAQFLLFMLALLLSLLGSSFFNRNKTTIIILLFILAFIPKDIYANIVESIANWVPGDIIKERLYDASKTIGKDDLMNSGTHAGKRYERIPFLISEFLKNPLFGQGKSTGHVFWFDHLSLFGLVGIIPWILILRDHYKSMHRALSGTFVYYQIALLMFIIIGFMKGSGSREQLIILFFILPLGIFLFNNGLLFRKKIKNA
jgi:hypothetical protein